MNKENNHNQRGGAGSDGNEDLRRVLQRAVGRDSAPEGLRRAIRAMIEKKAGRSRTDAA